MLRTWRVAIGVLLLAGTMCGEGRADPPFDEQYALVVRIGRGELSAEEEAQLKQEMDMVLDMYQNEHTGPLVRLFAELPDAVHARLKEQGYLKWAFKDLSEPRKKVFRDMVQTNIRMSLIHRVRPNKGFSLEGLERADVGVMVVDIPNTEIRYASLFILWTETEIPTWVTVVNVKKVGTPAYFDKHTEKVAELRGLPRSALPESDVALP